MKSKENIVILNRNKVDLSIKLDKLREQEFIQESSESLEILTAQEKTLFENIVKNNPDSNTDSNISTQAQFVSEYLNNLPVVRLTIAFTPNIAFERKLADLISNKLRNVLLDIIVDPEILGGSVLEYAGKHVDKSIINLFDLGNEF